MFHGLSAFPLTPLQNNRVDHNAFLGLINRLTEAKVDSIGVLGSTGCYPYLNASQRKQVTELAVEAAGHIPVMVGIGAVNSYDVLTYSEDAQKAGASALMLAPVAYHVLNENEVYHLFEMVSREISVPLCVYNNSGTTHFTFTNEFYAKIAQLPHIAAIKTPAISNDISLVRQHIQVLRDLIPSHVKIGVSTDSLAAYGVAGGADVWFSATAGLLPTEMLNILRAVQKGDIDEGIHLSEKFTALWQMVAKYKGSVRCVATMAEIMQLVQAPCLPHPLMGVDRNDKEQLNNLLHSLQLI